MPCGGNNNLIPTSERNKAEASAMGRKGGVESGKARRRISSLNKAAKQVLSLTPETSEAMRDTFRRLGVDTDGDELTIAYMILCKVANQALQGDLDAVEELAKLAGEDANSRANRDKLSLERQKLKQAQRVQVDVNVPVIIDDTGES